MAPEKARGRSRSASSPEKVGDALARSDPAVSNASRRALFRHRRSAWKAPVCAIWYPMYRIALRGYAKCDPSTRMVRYASTSIAARGRSGSLFIGAMRQT